MLLHAAEAGLKKLQNYEEIIYESKIPFIAIFLNPVLKLNYFKEHKYPRSKKIREVKNMISDYFSNNYDNVDEESDVPKKDERDENEFSLKRSKVSKISFEIQKFCLWSQRKHLNNFPKLTKMARDILPAQSASVAVERELMQ